MTGGVSVTVVALAPSFKEIVRNSSIKAFVESISSVVVGTLVGAVRVIAIRNIIDLPQQ